MAAAALEKAAKALGHTIKVETQGSVGAKNQLTPEDIAAADAVVIAADHIERLPAAIDIVLRKEQPILKAARAPGFTVDKLKAAWLEADQIK